MAANTVLVSRFPLVPNAGKLLAAALTAMGSAPGQLELHMRGALNVGVTRAELLEIVIQMALYAGLPACMNGVTASRAAQVSPH
jgi:4-carboxymuconolactone decarboxylase